MTGNARQRALAFLHDDHQLTLAEAEEALAVAATVLDAGLARLQNQAEAHNALACAEAGHSLKGNLLNLGLPDLARTAQHASDMAGQGNLAAAKAAGESLALALAPLLPGQQA